MLPSFVFLGLLIIYPLINAVILSLHSRLIYEVQGEYVGLKNYVEVLRDRSFWHALWINVLWTAGTVGGQLLIGIIGALLLHEVTRCKGLIRALVMLPFFIPTISVTLAWRWLLNPNFGLINYILKSTGIITKPLSWLSSPQLALGVIIFIAIWRYFPFVLINVLARLQTIPPELYEAARIDGATRWKEFRYITFPEIADVLSAVTVLRIVFMFKKVDEIMMLTGGGPGNATENLSVLAYRIAFQGMQFSKGATISILTFLILLGVVIVSIAKSMKAEG